MFKKNNFYDLLESYNKEENENINNLSNYIEHKFNRNFFDHNFFPKRILREEEIIKYIDEMHDNKPVTKKFQLSKTDFILIDEVYKNIDNILTNLDIKKKIFPFSSILSALGDYRIINKILKKKNSNIFEVGPGSGYLGAFLLKDGHNYSSTDNTQAFYIWQNILYSEINEHFDGKNLNPSKKLFQNKSASHLTWWNFYKLGQSLQSCHEHADLILCNAVLGEVPNEMVKYISLITKKLFMNNEINNNNSSFLFVKSIGAQHFLDYYKVLRNFNENGFEYIQFNEFLLFFLRDGKFGQKFKIKNLLPKKKQNKLSLKLILAYNSLISFFYIKKYYPHFMELKNFDRTRASDNYMNYNDLKSYLSKKNLLDDKYNFIDLIDKQI